MGEVRTKRKGAMCPSRILPTKSPPSAWINSERSNVYSIVSENSFLIMILILERVATTLME